MYSQTRSVLLYTESWIPWRELLCSLWFFSCVHLLSLCVCCTDHGFLFPFSVWFLLGKLSNLPSSLRVRPRLKLLDVSENGEHREPEKQNERHAKGNFFLSFLFTFHSHRISIQFKLNISRKDSSLFTNFLIRSMSGRCCRAVESICRAVEYRTIKMGLFIGGQSINEMSTWGWWGYPYRKLRFRLILILKGKTGGKPERCLCLSSTSW